MKTRNILFVALALGFLIAAGAGGFVWWQRKAEPTPQPPLLDLQGENDPDLASAVETVRQGVLREPRSANAWGKLGKLLLANGYRDEAIPCFEQAARLAPEEARWPYFQGLAQQMNNLDAAVICFRQATRLAGSSEPAALSIRLRYAEALLNRGDMEEARPLLEELLSRHPANPRIQLALGALAEDAKDLDTAITHLLRCADDPLTRQRAATHLATLYLRKGDAVAAERYRKRARRLPRDPEGPDPFVEEYSGLMVGRQALFLRAEYLLLAGEIQKAIELLQTLIEGHPDAVEAHVKLGMAWAELGNYQQAETVLRQALAARPETVQAHYFLCVALFHQAERNGSRTGFEAAATEARQTLALKPDHAYAHLYLGLALQKMNQREAALGELRQAVRFSPESIDPHLHLGEALLKAGKKEDGLAQLEKAADLADDKDQRPREALKKWGKTVGSW
jgi:tetratricopeptide (TPR) repeat protein